MNLEKIDNKDYAIKMHNLSKKYKIYDHPVDRLKESLHPFKRKYHKDFHALDNISLMINKGDNVGIIGKNGAGKSTLLKILTGVLTPSSGEVQINGKVSALLELGAGFNPELTGIENVYFNGYIMGYSREEMDNMIDDILSFADIGDFVNQAVKTYSSGMFVRLAFSVATAVDPDILIIDEALSVGDIRFQQKSIRRMQSFQEQGKTILFVTHDVGAVNSFCNKALWLNNGMLKEYAQTESVTKKYLSYMTTGLETTVIDKNHKEVEPTNEEAVIWDTISSFEKFGDGGAEILGVALYDELKHKKLSVFSGGESVSLMTRVQFDKDVHFPIIGFHLKDRNGIQITGANTFLYNKKVEKICSGEIKSFIINFKIPKLMNGEYTISPAVAEGTMQDHITLNWIHDAIVIKIQNPKEEFSIGWFLPLDDIGFKER